MGQLSLVAGIVDKHGNLNRVVITLPGNLRFHVNKGEHTVILPGRVQEPVPNEKAFRLIQRLEDLVKARRARLIL